MADQRPLSGRKVIVVSAISLSAGIIGTLVGKIFGTALQTTPAWVGPAIFIGSIALVLVGALLLPAAGREIKATPHGPAA